MANNPVQDILTAAGRLDRRRQIQIANQLQVINRLLEDSSYDEEMKRAQKDLATAQEALEHALQELQDIREADPR